MARVELVMISALFVSVHQHNALVVKVFIDFTVIVVLMLAHLEHMKALKQGLII